MKRSFVAINIIGEDNKLLNKNGEPIIFYWDVDKDLTEELKQSEAFIKFVKEHIFNIDNYSYTNIVCSEYILDTISGEEVYNVDTTFIQDMFPLLEIGNEELFYENYITEIMLSLYKDVFKEAYDNTNDSFYGETTKNIYTILKNKYGAVRVNLSWLIEYLKKQLSERYSINKENVDYISNKIINTII